MPHGIYHPDDAAQFFAAKAGQKYRPSNGSEGDAFHASWCDQCRKDDREDCPIRAATYCYDRDDPKYPNE